MNGSNGPLLYTHDDLSFSDHWNRMPVTVRHPVRNGVPVSARSPDVLREFGIGDIYGAVYDGKLRGEAWLDVELTERHDATLPPQHKIIPRIRAGKPIEVSTGLFTTNEPAPEGATWNGVPYTHIARKHKPDHLAILPDQTGACSVTQGCGLMVNEGKGCETDVDTGRPAGKRRKKRKKAYASVITNDYGQVLNCGGEGSGKPGPCPAPGSDQKDPAKQAKLDLLRHVAEMVHLKRMTTEQGKKLVAEGTYKPSHAELAESLASRVSRKDITMDEAKQIMERMIGGKWHGSHYVKNDYGIPMETIA